MKIRSVIIEMKPEFEIETVVGSAIYGGKLKVTHIDIAETNGSMAPMRTLKAFSGEHLLAEYIFVNVIGITFFEPET